MKCRNKCGWLKISIFLSVQNSNGVAEIINMLIKAGL